MQEPSFDAAIEALAPWLGRKRIVDDEIAPSTVRRICGMLDQDLDRFAPGDPLPGHWFAMFFAESTRQSDIGPDGHPEKGVLLPPIPLPRRMGAGRRVNLQGCLRVGVPARQTVEVAAITPKQARTGQIAILTMRHTVESEGRTIAVDEFDAIYREAPKPGAASPRTEPRQAPEGAVWRDSHRLSNALVFRYSALTWNAHRIHYDSDYARDEEGYPALVQNGGLTMLLMAEAARKRMPVDPASFSVRLTHPLYVGEILHLCGSPIEAGETTCWAVNDAGVLCGEMRFTLPD